jgi:hypothetical protein
MNDSESVMNRSSSVSKATEVGPDDRGSTVSRTNTFLLVTTPWLPPSSYKMATGQPIPRCKANVKNI